MKRIKTNRIPSFKKIAIFTAVALLVGTFGYIGVKTLMPSSALTTGRAALSLNPSSTVAVNGAIIPVMVKLTSGTTAVSTVRANLTYPSSQLQFVSVTNGTALPTVQRTNTGTAGTIDIIRAVGGGGAGVTGENVVVTINFRVIGTSGSIPLNFTNSSEAYDNTGSGTNILDFASSGNASYAFGSTDKVPLYRLANWMTNERLFTISYQEALDAQKNYKGWVLEGVAMHMYPNPGPQRAQVYRLANWMTNERLFTISYQEALDAQKNYKGWVLEGVAFYASTNTSDPAVYRLANWMTNERLFTTSLQEAIDAQTKYKGWVMNGIAFYSAP